MPPEIHLALGWYQVGRPSAWKALIQLVEGYLDPAWPWSLVYGEDPDRENQHDVSGTGRAACLEALRKGESGYGPALSGQLALPAIGRTEVFAQVFDSQFPVELVVEIPEITFAAASDYPAAILALLDIGIPLLVSHGAEVGCLDRGAYPTDLVDRAAADFAQEKFTHLAYVFWAQANTRFRIPRVAPPGGVYLRGGAVVLSAGRTLLPYHPVEHHDPPQLVPFVGT